MTNKKITELEAEHSESKKTKKKLKEHTIVNAVLGSLGEDLVYCPSWGQFLLFDGTYYERKTKDDIEAIIIKVIEERFLSEEIAKMTSAIVAGSYKLLIKKTTKRVKDTELAHSYIAFDNCLLNTDTWEEQAHTNEIYCWKRMGVDLTEECGGEEFLKYLQSTFVYEEQLNEYIFDPTLMDVVQEMLGSLFSGDKKAKRMFIFIGEGANGKSVLTETLLQMYEDQYVESSSFDQLSSNFGKARLVGKQINICSEEESKRHTNDIIKVLVTGELFSAERKHEDGFSYRNYATLISSTNNPPSFGDFEHGMKRRIIPIPFNRTFELEEQDPKLIEKLLEEKVFIVKFALQGLKRLQKNNYQYTQNSQIDALMSSLGKDSSNVIDFIDEKCIIDRTVTPIEPSTLYEPYKAWCETVGRKHLAKNRFVSALTRNKEIKDEARTKKRDKAFNKYLYYIKLEADDLPKQVEPPTQYNQDLNF